MCNNDQFPDTKRAPLGQILSGIEPVLARSPLTPAFAAQNSTPTLICSLRPSFTGYFHVSGNVLRGFGSCWFQIWAANYAGVLAAQSLGKMQPKTKGPGHPSPGPLFNSYKRCCIGATGLRL